MNELDSLQTIYPRLTQIVSTETLSLLVTLESAEHAFAAAGRNRRQQYLRALCLKAGGYLGHLHFQPGQLPRQMRIQLAEQLNTPADCVGIDRFQPGEMTRIMDPVREFLQLQLLGEKARTELRDWFYDGPARRDNDVAALVNEIILRLRREQYELPRFERLLGWAQQWLETTNHRLEIEFEARLNTQERDKLDSLLLQSGSRTPFDRFHDPAPKATANTLRGELERLREIDAFMAHSAVLDSLSRRKLESYAEVAARFTAGELRQLSAARRLTSLACYVVFRRAQLLDCAVETFIRIRDHLHHSAKDHADTYRRGRSGVQETHQAILRDLISLIRKSGGEMDLWRNIHTYRDKAGYDSLWGEIESGLSWKECYYQKLRGHYSALRRFLPLWYEAMPLAITITDDSLLRAIALLRQPAVEDSALLPTERLPLSFLTAEWQAQAVERHRWNGQILKVHKAPYELGLLDATAAALEEGIIAVSGANRYAPMTDHLLERSGFLADYSCHVGQLGCPETAAPYYESLRVDLANSLAVFDRDYDQLKRTFQLNRKGRVRYSRPQARPVPQRIRNLAAVLKQHIPIVTILELLLDCHRLTGFLDFFQPLSGRQNMAEEERLRLLIACLYAYGCNCGPSQAGQATGYDKQRIVYTRRRYMNVGQLMEAALALADCYKNTAMARRLGDPGIFMTDSMRLPTVKSSLTARQHHRYLGEKSILLYQHVLPSCVCLFSQALLCNVSEAIHMLNAIHRLRQGKDPLINICDNAGKSDLVFGLARLLNILIWPRARSGHLKLWAPSPEADYENIANGLAGTIQWQLIDEGWQDMMWVLASIAQGVASPSVIVERLSRQKNHPATLGFQELGKAERSLYLLRYGLDPELRRLVTKYTARREHWNDFARDIFQALSSIVKEKSQEGQTEVFWFLTVIQNAVVLWNALAIEQAVERARAEVGEISEDDLRQIFPTMLEHINFVGKFDLDMDRETPFRMSA